MSKTISPQSKLVAYTFLVSIFSLFMCNVDGSINNTTGFSIDIFHRDSPLSPTYNSSLTPDQHLTNAVQRSIERVRLINSHILNESPYAYIRLSKGAYLTSFNLGTPPVTILVSVDTGSNVIWTQCKGCTRCFRQGSPYFDPQHSSTYKRVRCGSKTCLSIEESYCDVNNREFCKYNLAYADRTFSSGDIAADTLTFRSTDRRIEPFPSVFFGCGYNSGSSFFTGQESGVLGIGSGDSSLIGQLDYAIKGKFSFCLVSLTAKNRASLLNFGDSAIVSGPGTVSTRFFLSGDLYRVKLDAVSLNNIRLEYIDTLNKSKVNNSKVFTSEIMIIDTGTTLTFLNVMFYEMLTTALKSYLRLNTVADPGRQLDTCFVTKTGIRLAVTFHFPGANVDVRADNLFIRRNANVICLLVLPVEGESILGNNALVNILVGFDIRSYTVSFRRTDCEKYI